MNEGLKGHKDSWPPLYLSPVPQEDIDRGDGEEVCESIELLCTITKDGFAGKAGDPIVLREWQRQLIFHLFARRKDGRLRHRTALIGMPRKNAKSALGSGLALDELIFGGKGVDVFTAAAEKEQARIVFNEVKAMVKGNPELSEIAEPLKDVIYIPSTNSTLTVLSAEAYSKEGLNIKRAIVDELHAHQSDDLWNVLTLASAARIDPLVVAITTAGVKTYKSTGGETICYQLYEYGRRLASGEIEDPSFFFAWWGAPQDADYRDPETWRLANPGFGDLVDPDDFASAVRRTKESEFRTKRLNQWVSSVERWFPAGVWEQLVDAKQIERGARVILGFDGSRTGDATALVAVSIEEIPHIQVVGVWERPIDADPTYQVPRAEVLKAIREQCAFWNVVEVACDIYLWQTEMQELLLEGYPIVQINQSGSPMVEATQRFFEAVMTGMLTHDGDPVMTRHIENAVLKQASAGKKLSKDNPNSMRKIDAAVAAVMAFDRAHEQADSGDLHVY